MTQPKVDNKWKEKIREIATQGNTLGYSLEEMNEKITNELFKLTKDKITQTQQEILQGVKTCPKCKGREHGCFYCEGKGFVILTPETIKKKMEENDQ